MDYKDLKVVITGGTGFIGTHILSNLRNQGCDITALVRDDDIIRGPKARQVRGDIRNVNAVERLYFEGDPDLVLHFAAIAPVGHAYKAPLQAIEVNTMGTATLLEVHRRLCPSVPIILTSSDKAYGSVDYSFRERIKPLTENDTPYCSHPYDASKYAADIITRAYINAYELKAYITRPANVYGPGDTHFNRLIPYALRCALLNEKMALRSDGSSIRHYLYIGDIVRAYLETIDKIFDGTLYPGVYNISYKDTDKSVLEVLAVIDNVLGTKLQYEVISKLGHETQHLLIEGSKFVEATGWVPTVSFEDGIERTAEWMNTYLGLVIGIEEKYKR